MKVYYASMTGNVRRFIAKTGVDASDIKDDSKPTEPFVLVTYTFGFGDIPAEVDAWLTHNHELLRGVAVSGNGIKNMFQSYRVSDSAYLGINPGDIQHIELVSQKPTKNQRITTLEQKVEAMQAEIDALKAAQKSADIAKIAEGIPKMIAKEKKRTPNEQRKAIIDEAKAFLEEVEREQNDSKVRDKGNAFHRQYLTKTEFIVNAEKRTVVAIIRTKYGTTLLTKAIAKCNPSDVFNADIGKAIALGRALGLDVSKFEKAAQPSEVVVGHIFDTAPGGGNWSATVTKMYPSHDGYGHGKAFKHTHDNGWLGEKQVTITNDTEAQY